MRLPWQDKTGLAKTSAVLATVVAVSLGLCGLNFVAYQHLGGIYSENWLSDLLFYASLAESAVILTCTAALVIVWLLELFEWIRGRWTERAEGKQRP